MIIPLFCGFVLGTSHNLNACILSSYFFFPLFCYKQMGKRPQLSNELEALLPKNDPKVSTAGSGEGSEESATLRFLVDLYKQCTERNPVDRPKAADIYELLVAHMSTLNSSRS